MMFHKLYQMILSSSYKEKILLRSLLKYGPLDFCTCMNIHYSGITCEDIQGLSDGKKASKGHQKIYFSSRNPEKLLQ